MKDIETKQRFVELRAGGSSFEKIAAELGVSKPTLLNWSKEFSKEVKQGRFLRFEGLIEQYALVKEERVKALAEVLRAALSELKSRDMKEVSTEKLVGLVFTLQEKLLAELGGVGCEVGEGWEIDKLLLPHALRVD